MLAVGNYLNGQSNRGGASGFRLDIIDKANDVKSFDNRTTLMMYVLKVVEDTLEKPFFSSDDEIAEMETISKLPIT
jgi:hypothetical protein